MVYPGYKASRPKTDWVAAIFVAAVILLVSHWFWQELLK